MLALQHDQGVSTEETAHRGGGHPQIPKPSAVKLTPGARTKGSGAFSFGLSMSMVWERASLPHQQLHPITR